MDPLLDAAILAANPRTAELIRSRYPGATDADLARAIRIAQWLMEPEEALREGEIASYLLKEVFHQRPSEDAPDIPLW